MSDNNFAIEPLENRLEQCYIRWYIGWCVRYVWGFPVYYLCWKWYWVC